MRPLLYLHNLARATSVRNNALISRCYHGANIKTNASAQHVIDLRSDVLTVQSPEMLQAMTKGTFGCDVFNEDETVHSKR